MAPVCHTTAPELPGRIGRLVGMDRLFGHHVFAALVVATIAIGAVPPLVENWSRNQEEAAEQRALDKADEIRGGAQPAQTGSDDSRGARVSGWAVLVVVSVVAVGWWALAGRRDDGTRWGRLADWRL